MTTAADIIRDNAISADTSEIDPAHVNWICKAIRRDPRYSCWTDDYLERLGVLGLNWETVTDEEIQALARKLAKPKA